MANILLLIIVIISGTNSLELPNYVSKCNVKKDIGKCVVNQSDYVIKNLINGDKRMRIPNLNPYHLDEIIIDTADIPTFKLQDVIIYNLGNAVLQQLDAFMEKQQTHIIIFFPQLQIKSKYDIQGRVFNLPIVGNGDADIIFTNVTFEYLFNWSIETRANKEQYHRYTKAANATYTADNIHYQFDNLFNGDGKKGDEMNALLNKNWKEFSNDFALAVSRSVSDIFVRLMNAFATRIPFSKLLDYS